MALEEKGLLSLPPEILADILSSDCLDDADVCRISQVCERLNDVCTYDEIWKTKFRQCWPMTTKEGVTVQQGEWKEFFKFRKKISRHVQQLVKDVACGNYDNDRHCVSNGSMDVFSQIAKVHEKGLHMVLEDLLNILKTDSHTNLTDKYYARKALRAVRQKLLSEEFDAFLKLPPEEQHLEKGAYLISCWIQPVQTIPLQMSDISSQLDELADEVRAVLSAASEGSTVHPACSKDNSITGFTENLWSTEKCEEVLAAVTQVFYDKLLFMGNVENYYDPTNSCIEKVLETKVGIPITLSIIYSAVARRLGVICHPVNAPSHFLLMFRGDAGFHSSERRVLYIDAFHGGRIMTKQQCIEMMQTIVPDFSCLPSGPATPANVLERMACNLVNLSRGICADDCMTLLLDSVSLFLNIVPTDQDMVILYGRLCLHFNVNLLEARALLQKLPDGGGGLRAECERRIWSNAGADSLQKEVKERHQRKEVLFSVGMIMRHKKYDYICVIYGWDHKCQASSEWINRMSVNHLKHTPFYNVLADDGTTRYAAQENLLFTPLTKEITHPEVGKFFEEYTGQYYVPNIWKQKEYPEDAAATRETMDEYFRNRP